MFTEDVEFKRSLTGWGRVRRLRKQKGSQQVVGEMSLEFGLNINSKSWRGSVGTGRQASVKPSQQSG